jgi:palmitoyltransferase
MLQEPGFFAECSIKPPVRPYRRSLVTACLYPVGFPASVFLSIFFTIQRNSYSDLLYPGLAFYILISLLSFIFFLLAACKDPGYLRSKADDTLLSLFLRYEPYMVCSDCVVWRPARSRHCQCCDRCVEKFDHHCPWLSNCIGARNLGFFYIFIVCTELSLAITATAGFLALLEGGETLLEVRGYVVKIVGGVLGVSAGFFLLPLSALFFVQTQNFLAGTTTNERFSNKKKAADDELNISTASMLVDRSSRLRNCINMCCNAPTSELPRKSQAYHPMKEEEMESSRDLDTSDVQITQ